MMKPHPPKPDAVAPKGESSASPSVAAPATAILQTATTQPPDAPGLVTPTRPLPGRRPAAAAPVPRLTLDDAAALVGTMVGEHRLKSLLGKGGMGAVYEAEQLKIGRRDAVKILFPDLAGPENAERFLREAQAANRVQHPNIVQIYHFGTTQDGLLYLVMELLGGSSLDARLQKSRRGIENQQALQIAHDVASCLAAVHKEGIVHRDLTPRNIMLVPKPSGPGVQVKLLDFGIAKVPPRLPEPADDGEELTGIGIVFGTLEYMPPEQFRDARSVDDKGDVFSLAVILCEMMSGARPFPGFANRLFVESPPEPKLPLGASVRLRGLLRRMLTLEPARRPAMSEVVKTLERELRPAARRTWVGLTAGAVMTLTVVGIFLARRTSSPLPMPPLPELRSQARAILNQAAKDADAGIRKRLAIELGKNQLPEFCAVLERLLQDPDVRTEALQAVATMRCPGAKPELLRLITEQNPLLVRIEAASALARLDAPAAVSTLRGLSEGLTGMRLIAAQRWCELPDPAGCTKLAEILPGFAKPPLPLEVELDMHRALAVGGSKPALAWLRQQLGRADQPVVQMKAAATLAQLRSQEAQAGEARALIEKQAAAGDITAALQAAQLHSTTGLDTLQRWSGDSEKKTDSRVLAIRAMGASGQRSRTLPVLYGLLKETGAAARPLHLAAAAAILRMLGDERDLNDWEIALLDNGGSSSSLLQWMNDESRLTPQQAVNLFANLSAPERQLLTSMMGRRKVGYTLGILSAALDDANSDVQIEGRRALVGLVKVLERSDQAALSPALVQQLQGMRNSTNLNDQVVALSLSARLGKGSARGELLALFQRTADVRIRELIVELSPAQGDNPILRAALQDRARSVRYLGARTLAEAGSDAGKPVLEELLKLGGGYSLAAYGWLKRLGFHPAAMDWLSLLSTEQLLPVRYEAVGMLADLPVADVLPLLRFALSDPAAVVRGRAGEVAAAMYRKYKQDQYLEIIQILLTDSEEVTRLHAARLLRELAQPEPPPDLGPSPPTPPVPPSPPPVIKTSLPPPPPPPSPVLLLMQAALTAERQGELQTAMSKWEALQQSYARELTPHQTREAEQAVQRLRGQLGSFRLLRNVNGKCEPESKIRWGKPGYNEVMVDGQSVKVFLYKGIFKDNVAALCKKVAP